MPAPARQPPGDLSGILGIIEDQQPPAPDPQLGQYRGPHTLRPRATFHTLQLGAKGGELIPDKPALLAIDPPCQVIGPSKPACVLGC